ncbi:hypothetical protein DFQ28_011015 [Apophysomyces sp. BC1034]|nr:hypothetical protein DFQ30_010764 [Apophysomyces sp. BC1015]KAG0169635.1 hypothetical protein DFQ29_009591 [Apophysomyces sp. BC1021]KAG0184519.1 hypothetical protein DFQ28_011015 [Apophysomyces sp. BC1034]
MTNKETLQQLQALSKEQSTRVALYKEFNDAFDDYIAEKCPPEQYYSICKIVTEGFEEVSLEIQSIERDLANSRNDLAQLVRRLQNIEKEKLHKTAKLQILTIESRTGEKDFDVTIEEYRQRLREVMAEIQEVWDEIRQEMAELSCAD